MKTSHRRVLSAVVAAMCWCNASPSRAQLVNPPIRAPEIDTTLGVRGSIDWIASAQQKDGSWHRQTAKDDDGLVTLSRNHATGLGLLALLGAGQTHKEGEYKQQMQKGIDFLVNQIREEDNLGDLRGDGDLAGHGAAALALCEVHAMTVDPLLLVPAQLAVRFTERCQNEETGGWGSQDGKADDIHQMGWHVLTLRSAWQSKLLIRERTIPRLSGFLDTQQVDDGRWYSRVMDGRDGKATAIGLLGRGETGWNPAKDKRWQAGAQWLAKQDPAAHDAQYNFWATQVIRHADSEHWSKWNAKMRDQILESQWKDGAHRGSWYDAKDRHADRGRFYQTALNTMTMEIYYRHLMVYDEGWKGEEEEDADSAEPGTCPFGGDDPLGR